MGIFLQYWTTGKLRLFSTSLAMLCIHYCLARYIDSTANLCEICSYSNLVGALSRQNNLFQLLIVAYRMRWYCKAHLICFGLFWATGLPAFFWDSNSTWFFGDSITTLWVSATLTMFYSYYCCKQVAYLRFELPFLIHQGNLPPCNPWLEVGNCD